MAKKRTTKKVAKKPESPMRVIPEMWDSMKAASNGLGISYALVQRAKKEGCVGFRSNRVYTLELIQWIAESKVGQQQIFTHKDEREKWQAEREKIKAAEDARRVIGRSLVTDRYRENLSLLFQRLHRAFVHTMPPLYQGMDTSECATLNETELSEIQIFCEERANSIGEE